MAVAWGKGGGNCCSERQRDLTTFAVDASASPRRAGSLAAIHSLVDRASAGEVGVRRPGRKISRVYDPYYCYGSCAGGNGRLTNDEAGAWMGWKRPWPVGAAYRGVRQPN